VLRARTVLATPGDARVTSLLKLHLSLLVPLALVCGSLRPCCFVLISEQFVSKINVSFLYRVEQWRSAKLYFRIIQMCIFFK
jgi:hypothetical protein